jgi:hypothetical protein
MKRHGVFVGLIVLMMASRVHAQSTIFNIPTTDVVSTKKVYAEFDYLSQMPKADAANRLHVFVPRVVVGLGANVEAGANVALYHTSGATNAFIQPNVKWKFAANDNKGVAGSAGAILYTPLNNRTGVDTYGLVYGNFSKKVKTGSYGPRFTAGPYGIVGASSAFAGPKGGIILGYEQPVHAKASIVADWFSGKNGFGYFTPGISVTLPHNGLFNAGYSIGNDSWENDNATHNRLLFIYYGVTF